MELIFKETCEVKREYTIDIEAQVYANFMCEFIETTEEPF